jgi:adenylate kinase family enzyme
MGSAADTDLSRVVVIGTSSSGKTTFARDLASLLGVDHTDLDSLFWLPGWQERELDDFRARVAAWADGEHWVVDGNYTASATFSGRARPP